jgi:hypothetical protein
MAGRPRATSARRLAALLAVLALVLSSVAAAAPHKILVLPVDGSADAATRSKLTARLARLARTLDGQVATADATFADTALAVGCDPQAAGCSDLVIATLGVDELVWGTARKAGGQTRLIARRATRGAPPRELTTTIAAADPPERIDLGIAPLFEPPEAGPELVVDPDPAAAEEPASAGAEVAAAPPPAAELAMRAPVDHGDRNLGIGLTAGGGITLALGLALLASYASLQRAIDQHPTEDSEDFEELVALEDRAASRAIAGDLLVVAGLAAGGLGVYFLYRSHRRSRLTVAPAPMGQGAGLVLTIVGEP